VTDIVIVLTTAPADDRAEQLARQLVDDRLAACVNVHAPMVSVYRWKGEVQRDGEARIKELHSYELPELVVLDVRASEAYSAWVIDQTQKSAK
jgi:periplasmic divalent cation tolerance protein